MKKLLLSLTLLLMALGFVTAQNISDNFESGTATLPWLASNGKFLGVVNNPKTNAVNNSTKCIGYIKSDSSEYSLFGVNALTTPLKLNGNSRFKVQIYANRDAVTKFIFKLEGAKGAKEFTKRIVVGKAWQEYSFDFKEIATNDAITKIFFFFDPGVKASKDTFYIDNLQQLADDACSGIVSPTTVNLLDDFECNRNASYSGSQDSLSVVDNPNKTGINTSAKVGKYNDVVGNGTEYAFLMHNNIDAIDLSKFPYLRVKLIAPKAGTMLLKIEGGSSIKEVATVITADQVGKWVEATADFASVQFAGNNKLVMFFNAGVNGAAGDVYYIDDIQFTEVPPLEDFETTPKLTWAPSGGNTALHGTFGGAVANPKTNPVNSSPTVGKYTKGSAAISILTGSLPSGFKLTNETPQLNLMVYGPTAGKKVQIQLVSATQGNISAEATLDSANAWQNLAFDFKSAVAIADISTMNILFNSGTAESGVIYHFDNLNLSKSTLNPCKDVVAKPLILDDFECQRNGKYAGTPPLSVVPNPNKSQANGSDFVGKYDDPKDEWSALVIDYGANAIDLSRFNQLTVKIWSPKVVPLLFKLEGGTSPAYENPMVNVTTASAWVTYKIDFSGQKGKNHKKIAIFFNAGVAHTTDDTYYIDDITWDSEPLTGCVTDFETPFLTFKYFANKDLDGTEVKEVANPKKSGINTSNRVLEFERRPGAEVFAGAFADLPAVMKWTNSKIILKAKVLMDHIGNFAFKLEGSTTGPNNIEIPVANTKVNEWEQMTIDFSGKIKPEDNYKRLTMFIDLTLPVATTAQKSYIDDIVIGDQLACGTTGIFETPTVERLSVYPNPATNDLYIRGVEKIRRLEIVNMLGQSVSTTVLVNNSLDIVSISLQGLDRGIYIVNAYDEKGLVANSKFVKE